MGGILAVVAAVIAAVAVVAAAETVETVVAIVVGNACSVSSLVSLRLLVAQMVRPGPGVDCC
jgi:hypothetical protein